MNIGERIRQRRIELNLSVEEVAKRLGKNRATIYRYENSDIENLPAPILEPLAKILETSPSYLMGWHDTPNIIEILIKNLNKYLADYPISFHSNVIYLNELDNIIQNDELDDMIQNTLGLSTKKLNSILNGKHIPTSKELTNILDGLNIPIEALLDLPYPPSYKKAKDAFVDAALYKYGYILPQASNEYEDVLILRKYGCAYEININSFNTFISSIDDYISLNLKQLTLNGIRNPKLDIDFD